MDSVIYVVFFKALLHQPARRWLLKKRDETKKKSMGMKLWSSTWLVVSLYLDGETGCFYSPKL